MRGTHKPVTNFKCVQLNVTAVLYRKCNLKVLGSILSLSEVIKSTFLLKRFLVLILYYYYYCHFIFVKNLYKIRVKFVGHT